MCSKYIIAEKTEYTISCIFKSGFNNGEQLGIVVDISREGYRAKINSKLFPNEGETGPSTADKIVTIAAKSGEALKMVPIAGSTYSRCILYLRIILKLCRHPQ